MKKSLLFLGLMIAIALLSYSAIAVAKERSDVPGTSNDRCHGACCFENGECAWMTPYQCAQAGGTFMGDGVPCDPNPCDEPEPCPYPNRDVPDNNDCPPPEGAYILCGDTLCGEINFNELCHDKDYYEFVIPEGICYELVIDVFADDTPGFWTFGKGLDSKVALYNENCGWITGNDDNNGPPGPCGYDSRLETDCLEPGTYYIRVRGYDDSTGPYILAVACVECDDCCPVIIDYCEEPIIIPGVLYYENTANTCCATMVQECVYYSDCGSYCFNSGPSVVYQFTLEEAGTLDTVRASAPGCSDVQLMIFTDCSDPLGTCVASSATSFFGAEEILGLELDAGTYFVSTSRWSPLHRACGLITLLIVSDTHLPVELSSFEAIPRHREVLLRWTTASESNNDYFNVQRKTRTSGWATIAQVEGAGNSMTENHYEYSDRAILLGMTYTYRLISHDINGTAHEYGETVEATPDAVVPVEYALYQNFPNPFNPETQISYELKETGFVSLKVYNLIGQEVASLVNAKEMPDITSLRSPERSSLPGYTCIAWMSTITALKEK